MTITLGQIITLIVSSLIWIWMMRQVFVKHNRQDILRISIISSVSVLILRSIALLKAYAYISSSNLVVIITVISILILGFQSKRFVARITQSLLRIISGILPSSSHYILSAWSEESLKRGGLQKKTVGPLGDIILLCIMSGLVFGWTENIVYLISSSITQNTTSPISTIVARSTIPLLVHLGSIIATCTSAYILEQRIGNKFLARSLGLASGTFLHLLFNRSQVSGRRPISTLIIIIDLALISYGLVRSDALYEESNLS